MIKIEGGRAVCTCYMPQPGSATAEGQRSLHMCSQVKTQVLRSNGT